jgi:hypothetical protein
MRSPLCFPVCFGALLLCACTTTDETSPRSVAPRQSPSAAAWGPETPQFNLEVILRGDGFGHVTFRQPNDDNRIVYLDTWVRDLAPNASYRLQRAVDTNLDGECTSAAWLTLGQGSTPQTIDTDARGTGQAELFRDLGAFAPGATFDIHFRVIDAASNVVLSSDCYQFTVSQ